VIWRYDPIILSSITDTQFHKQKFKFIADKLLGSTFRCIISFVDIYRKIEGRLRELGNDGFILSKCENDSLSGLLSDLVEMARVNGIVIKSCASKIDLAGFGIPAGKCIDDSLIGKITGKQLELTKDPYQRKECRCVISKDIGMYDTCLYECRYCYATSSFERAKSNHKRHNPDSPYLIPPESLNP
jgi:hypothetical protein